MTFSGLYWGRGEAMNSISTTILSFEEWQALPETNQICEVVDGVLVMPPSPTDEHQWIGFEIATRLSNFVRERELGIILVAPRDVLIQRDPLRVRQPDVLFLSASRTGVRRPSDLAGQPRIESPPDLVVEVLSPSNTTRDVGERLGDYRSIGVPECWLASFEGRTIEVLNLTAEAAETTATYGLGDVLRSEVLPGFELAVDDVFGPLLG
jgi:Uma2 family endonuclease